VCMYAYVHECVLGGGAYANVRLCLRMRVSARVEEGNVCVKCVCLLVCWCVCKHACMREWCMLACFMNASVSEWACVCT